MNIILLPIRKEHSDNIFNGSKKYEYRKTFPVGIERILVYESRGAGTVVGEFDVDGIIFANKEDLWMQTYKFGGVSKSQFEEYFQNRDSGIAIKVGELRKYGQGKPLAEFGLRRAPQNYIWIERAKE